MRKGLSLSLSPAAVLITLTVERGGGGWEEDGGAADFEAATHE